MVPVFTIQSMQEQTFHTPFVSFFSSYFFFSFSARKLKKKIWCRYKMSHIFCLNFCWFSILHSKHAAVMPVADVRKCYAISFFVHNSIFIFFYHTSPFQACSNKKKVPHLSCFPASILKSHHWSTKSQMIIFLLLISYLSTRGCHFLPF